jgi:hypothetical protein
MSAARRRPAVDARRRAARAHVLVPALALAWACLGAPAVRAADPAAASAPQAPVPAVPPGFRDPGVPPALRADVPAATRAHALEAMRAAPRASGAALEAQVQRNLRETFDAADVRHRGALTREEARAGGFGYVDRHFEEIDTRHAGEVTFADLQDYLARRHAAAR